MALPAALGAAIVARDGPVTVVQLVPQATALAQLAHQPANLPADATAFLAKYQPSSNAASDLIGPKASNQISTAGWCFQETPCSSVDRVSVVSVPSSSGAALPALNPGQIASLLDSILATPETTYSDANHDTVFSGLKKTINGVVLEIIAPKGTVASALVAGITVDAFKASIAPGANAVRAVMAQKEGDGSHPSAICLYPDGAEPTAAQNFCFGKELDGSVTPRSSGVEARSPRGRGGGGGGGGIGGALGALGLAGVACGFIELPILC